MAKGPALHLEVAVLAGHKMPQTKGLGQVDAASLIEVQLAGGLLTCSTY